MESIKQIYKIGNGPSSSHTMAPMRAAHMFSKKNPKATSFEVTLYGSLAATGKGHMTDTAILNTLNPIAPTTILWKPKEFLPFHPNGMCFHAHIEGHLTDEWYVYSIGGGSLANQDFNELKTANIYELETIQDIQTYCEQYGLSYWEYVEQIEGKEIWDHLREVWQIMEAAVDRGLDKEGVLPGGLGLHRKAADFYIRSKGYTTSLKNRGFLFAYALAVAEQNACGEKIVTAPTCGSCGVIPAVLHHLKISQEFKETRILRALATAGLFGNIVRTNASISGAEVGCQGEIGVACAMAAAAASQLFGGTISQIEYAAEMGLEHHLGLTCDPVGGLVQIPCIERNAFAAARALEANTYANFTDGKHRVSFDQVVEVMRQTGHDLPSLYKETSEGGLARKWTNPHHPSIH